MTTPQMTTIQASHLRRRSTISLPLAAGGAGSRGAMTCPALLDHGYCVVGPRLEMNDLVRRRSHQILPFRQPFQPLRAEQLRLLQVYRAPLVEQLLLLRPQRLELVPFHRGGDLWRHDDAERDHRHAGGPDRVPACPPRLRIRLAHQAAVVDLLAEEKNVLLRESPQRASSLIDVRRHRPCGLPWRWLSLENLR